MSEFIEALQKSKGENELNILRNVIDKDILEKGKAGQLGEIRTWGGKKYQKTPKGWRPVKSGAHDGTSQEKPEEKKDQEVMEASSNKWPEGSEKIKHALDVMGGEKYSDPSKVSLDYDDKYGWAVSYDGREVGSLNKYAISKEQAKAAGWYKEGEKESSNVGDKNLVDEINRKLKEGHASVKDDMKEDAKKIAESGEKKKKSSKYEWDDLSDEEFNEKYFGLSEAEYQKAASEHEKAEKEFKSKWGDDVNEYISKINSFDDIKSLLNDARNLRRALQKRKETSLIDKKTVESYKKRFARAAHRGKSPQDVLNRDASGESVYKPTRASRELLVDAENLAKGILEDIDAYSKADRTRDMESLEQVDNGNMILTRNVRGRLNGDGESLSRRNLWKVTSLILESRKG